MQDDNLLALDDEQNPIEMRLAAMNELPDLKAEFFGLGSDLATLGKLPEALHRILQPVESTQAGLSRVLLYEPFEDVA